MDAVNLVLECFQKLRIQDNEAAQEATSWLGSYLLVGESIDTLLKILFEHSDQIMREFAAIHMKLAVKSVWQDLSEADQDTFFQSFINLLLVEPLERIRSLLVTSVQSTIQPKYVDLIMPIIEEAANTKKDIQRAMDIGLLLPDLEEEPNPVIHNSIIFFVQQCFTLDLPTKVTSYEFLYSCVKKRLVLDISEIWESILNLFDECIALPQLLSQVATITSNLLGDNIDICDTPSLYDKCIEYFYEQCVPFESYVPLFEVISSICMLDFEMIDQDMLFMQVIQIAFQLFFMLFNPDDESSILLLDFFGVIIKGIANSNRVLSVVWQFCLQIVSTDKGRFASAIALDAIYERENGFFEDKVDEIAQLLAECLSSEYGFIQDAAASTIKTFEPTFISEPVSGIKELSERLLRMIEERPTKELIGALSTSLSASSETVSIFNDCMELIAALLESGEQSLMYSALPCLSSLIKHGQSQVDEFLEPITRIIGQMVNLDEGDEDNGQIDVNGLKEDALECLSVLIEAGSENVRNSCGELIGVAVSAINDETPSGLILQCLKVVNITLQVTNLISEWPEEVIAYLFSIIEVNLDEELLQGIHEPTVEEGYEGSPFQKRFQISGLSLKILSRVCLSNSEFFGAHFGEILEAIRRLAISIEVGVHPHAMESLAIISEAYIKYNENNNPEITKAFIDIGLKSSGRSAPEALYSILLQSKCFAAPEDLMQLIMHIVVALQDPPPSDVVDMWVRLLYGVCRLLAPTSAEDMRAMSAEAISGGIQDTALLTLSMAVTASIPDSIDDAQRTELFGACLEHIAARDLFHAPLFLRGLSESSHGFLAPLLAQTFESLTPVIVETPPIGDLGRRIQQHALAAAIQLSMGMAPERLKDDEFVSPILDALPFKCAGGDSPLEAAFLAEVHRRTERRFDSRIMEIAASLLLSPMAAIYQKELSGDQYAALKALFGEIISSSSDEGVAALCNENEALYNNLRVFLGETVEQ